MIIARMLSKIALKIILLPCLVIITLADRSISNRIISGRYTFRDAIPHLSVIAIWGILLYANTKGIIKMDPNKIFILLPNLINFQGILFAASLAVSTFILTIFKPSELAIKHPNKMTVILDIVDDLRIANRIIFFATLYMFSIWLAISSEYLSASISIIISILIFLIWSIISIDSIIRGIFTIVKVD